MASLSVVPVLDGLRAWSDAAPNSTLYVFLSAGKEVARLTFGQLYKRAGTVAQSLLRDGLKPGDRVLLVFPPTHSVEDFVVAFYGCLRAGIIAVPVYPPTTRENVHSLLRIAASCGARVALTDATYSWVWSALRLRCAFSGQHVASHLKWRVISRCMAASDTSFVSEPVHAPRDVAFIQFSSGSTGHPRGVAVTHGSLAHNCALIRRDMRIDATCCEVSWLPLYHDMGLVGGLLTAVTVRVPADPRAVLRQAPCVLMSPLDFLADPLVWIRAMSEYGATHTQAPDFSYALVATRAEAAIARGDPQVAAWDLSSLQCALSGADMARPDTVEAFRRVFCQHARCPLNALVAGYGLAECTVFVSQGGSTVLTCDRDALEDASAPGATLVGSASRTARSIRILSCGVPPLEVDIIIVDVASGAQLTKEGAVGEVWLRSSSVAAGYWGDAATTRATFHAVPCGGLFGDNGGRRGYLRTGDLAFMHGGELFVTGRIKEVLVLRGKKHAPQDVEHTAYTACTALRPGRCAAFTADLAGGEACAVLVAELREPGSDTKTLCAIARQVSQSVAAVHGFTLADVVLVAPRTVPKTSSGKLRRSECRQRYDAGALGNTLFQLRAQRANNADIFDAAKHELESGSFAAKTRRLAVAICTHLGMTSVNADMFASGLDSAGAAALHTALEKQLLIALPPATVFESRTPIALAAAVVQLRWPADEDAAEWLPDTYAPALEPALQSRHGGVSSAGVALLGACTIIVMLHIVHMRTVLPVSWWSADVSRIVATDGPAYVSGWLPGKRIDLGHWRLLEWTRTVLPIHLLFNAPVACAIARVTRQPHRLLSPRSLTAAWGLVHAVVLHGVWALPPLLLVTACFAWTRLMLMVAACQKNARACKLRIYEMRITGWMFIFAGITFFNLTEPGNLLWPATKGMATGLEQSFVQLISGTRKPYVGLLGATSFTANRAFRYMALRLLSYVMDTAADAGRKQAATGLFDDLELFIAYALYPPLYLSGPVMFFSEFKTSSAAAQATKAAYTHASLTTAAIQVIASAICAAIAIEVALQTFYWPTALLHPSLTGLSNLSLPLRWYDYTLYGYMHLTATWASSAVVFAVPRGVALLQGVSAPNDTPALWVSACVHARSFWTQFHTSLFAVFCRYVYVPLGGGAAAVIAVTALSTMLHGFHAHWLVWGVSNACVLCLERALAARVRWYATPGVLVRAANQTTVIMLMGSLACGAGEVPAGTMLRVAAACFVLSALHTAWRCA